jgi:thiol-disulfide isomerase/thioredoxin
MKPIRERSNEMTYDRFARRRTAPARFALLFAAFAAMVLAAPAGAQAPSDSVWRGFQRTGDFLLSVDGKQIASAEIYQLQRPPAFLILTSALPAPVLVAPGAKTVETVHIMKVAKQKDGSVDLLADATLEPQGRFTVSEDGESVTFTVEGKKAALTARPPLLGVKSGSDLKAYSFEYARGAQTYVPNRQAIAALKKRTQPATVRVYFGSWCPHCKQHVPYLLRVEDELKGSKIRFEYVGLKPGFKEPEAKKVGLRAVPTGIVYVNGKEVGRLTDNDWNAPETSLNRILNSGAKIASGR